MCFVPIRYYTKISYITVIGALNVSLVNVIKFSPSDQQVLRFSLKSVQFDFDDGNSISGLGIELLISFAISEVKKSHPKDDDDIEFSMG